MNGFDELLGQNQAVSDESSWFEAISRGDFQAIFALAFEVPERVNSVDDAGYTALHRAAESANFDLMWLLLSLCARSDLGARNDKWMTPLQVLVASGAPCLSNWDVLAKQLLSLISGNLNQYRFEHPVNELAARSFDQSFLVDVNILEFSLPGRQTGTSLIRKSREDKTVFDYALLTEHPNLKLVALLALIKLNHSDIETWSCLSELIRNPELGEGMKAQMEMLFGVSQDQYIAAYTEVCNYKQRELITNELQNPESKYDKNSLVASQRLCQANIKNCLELLPQIRWFFENAFEMEVPEEFMLEVGDSAEQAVDGVAKQLLRGIVSTDSLDGVGSDNEMGSEATAQSMSTNGST